MSALIYENVFENCLIPNLSINSVSDFENALYILVYRRNYLAAKVPA